VAPTTPPSSSDLAAILAAPPRRPRDIDRFTSQPLFGEPGIYPDGSPMAPAAAPGPDERALVDALRAVGVDDAPARLADDRLVAIAPDPGLRAALLALEVTVGAPLLGPFLAAGLPLRYGPTASPGRVIGPDATGARVVNERYRFEHPLLVVPSLVHTLLWTGESANQFEEVVLHSLGSRAHLQLLARLPALAVTGTELARRQSSLTLSLFNSRRPGSARIVLVAPDGPGTIPGGDPGMQTPDFWSIPFAPQRREPADAPAALRAVLGVLARPGTELPRPVRYDPHVGELIDAVGGDDWLPPADQYRAGVALGALGAGEDDGAWHDAPHG
jgi:hypothetical protein